MTEVVRHLDVLPVLGHTVEGHHGAAEDAGEGGGLGPWERKGHPGTGSVTWEGLGLQETLNGRLFNGQIMRSQKPLQRCI